MKKRIKIAGLLLLMLPAVHAQNFTYTTNSDNTITITKYNGFGSIDIPSIIAEKPVTCIGSFAFADKGLEGNLTIPSTVTNIGSNAFGANFLTSVTIPDNVISIGDEAFGDCGYLSSATIGSGLTNVGAGPFSHCSRLASITVTNNNPALSSVDGVLFNKNQTTLIQYPAGNPSDKFTVPDGVTNIASYAFSCSYNLGSIIFPSSLVRLGDYALFNNSTMTNIFFMGNAPPGTDLGVPQWSGTSYCCNYLPGTTGWSTTFGGYTVVKWLTVNGGTSVGDSISANTYTGKIFDRWIGDTQYVASVTSAVTTVSLPAQTVTLTATYKDALYALTVTGGTGSSTCTNGQRISITANTPPIAKAFDKWTGDTLYVANAASASTTVTMPAKDISLTATYKDVLYTLTVNNGSGSGSYTNQQQVLIQANTYTDKIFDHWAGSTQYVANVTSADTMVTLPAQAVTLTATYKDIYMLATNSNGTITITGCNLPAEVMSIPGIINGLSVTRIANSAFWANSNLTAITIPASVTNIGIRAFSDCINLTKIYFLGDAPSLGSNVFSGSTNVTIYYLPETTGWTSPFGGRPALLALPYTYIADNGTIIITEYTGTDSTVTIPNMINGLPVTRIDAWAFYGCTSLTNVMIPGSITNIGDWAFCDCINLAGVYFRGDAPALGLNVFYGDDNAIIYHLPDTSWESTFGDCPAVAWNPNVQPGDIHFDIQSTRFGFTVTCTTNFIVVVEACTNLAEGKWIPVQTNTSISGSFSFTDQQSTNYPNRYYRLSMPQ